MLPEKIDGTLELSQAGGPYKLMGVILVAKGGTLSLERGAKVLCAPGARIMVDGQIASHGEGEQFVSFRPAVNGRTWGGISVPKVEERTVVLERFEIRGAECAVDMAGCPFKIADSILAQNGIGIKVGANGKQTIENCMIANNLKEGIWMTGHGVDVNHCTIADNGGVGLHMTYYGSAKVTASVISGNATGVKSTIYETVPEIHSCNIVRNRVAMDVRTKEQFQCTNNYWGTADTRQISAVMMDGRTNSGVGIVVFDPFEKKPIADAGCTLRVPK